MGMLERKGTLLAVPGIVIVLLEGLTRGWCENTLARIERTRRSDDVALSRWHCGSKRGEKAFAFVKICHSRFARGRERTLPSRFENCESNSRCRLVTFSY